GVLLGTAAYMSPEQARGTSADKRADLWAFGVVLFEMLTGKPLFEGATISDTLADVLTKDPDWTALPVETPTPVRRLLRRCLEKDRKQRQADVADARLEIQDALRAPEDVAQATVGSAVRSSRGARLAWTVAAATVFVAAGLTVPTLRYLRETTPPDKSETRTQINTGDSPPASGWANFALSPDGRQIVFVASSDGVDRLWLRSLATITGRPLAGTEGARSPFWAPDSRSVGFFAGNALKRLGLGGGGPQKPAPGVGGYGGGAG